MGRQPISVENSQEFCYEPDDAEALSTAVVTAVANANDEDVLEQEWLISEGITTDALDGLFQEHNLGMTLQLEADSTTATVKTDANGDQHIKFESHR